MMKCALKRIQAADASDDAGTFAEMEQAMIGPHGCFVQREYVAWGVHVQLALPW
jgi:hypothetical protein